MKAVLALCLVAACLGAAVASQKPCVDEWCLEADVPDFVELDVLFAVKQRNLEALDDVFWAVSTPGSPKYGEFMTHEELNELVTDPEASATVQSWLSENGVSEQQMKVSAGGEFIRVVAPVTTFEKLMDAKFYMFKAREEMRMVRSFTKSLPAEVEAALDFVTNVDDFPQADAMVKAGFEPKLWTSSMAKEEDVPVTPTDLASYYNIQKPFGSSNKNSMAVFECENQYFSPSDLTKFQQKYNLPNKPVANITGSNQADQPGLEAQLDVQYIGATGINIPLTFWYVNAGFFSPFPTIIANWAASVAADPKAPLVHSMSYGLGESNIASTPKSTLDRVNTEIQKMGARGISVFIASGDSGVAGRGANSDPSACGFDASWPASIPYITSVGATQFTNGNPADGETTCSIHNNPPALITSGGGFSTLFNRGSYADAAWKKWFVPGNEAKGQQSVEKTGRGIPDVSANGHNYQIMNQGSIETVDGTSCATPAFAGMIALINDRLLNAGKSPIGFANPTLYSLAESTPDVFNDITTGNNKCTEGICCPEGYNAVKGWDPATGLGSPHFTKLSDAVMQLKGADPATVPQVGLRGGSPAMFGGFFAQA